MKEGRRTDVGLDEPQRALWPYLEFARDDEREHRAHLHVTLGFAQLSLFSTLNLEGETHLVEERQCNLQQK